ncbi:MAG: hypothetical protein HYZ20_17330 [Burkholderiales bacterium]|nr:hypothetical protein [Burkholderiales bacterium]
MSPAARHRTLRRLAWACVMLMLVVTTASAWLRLAPSRPACLDWPGCRSAGQPLLTMTAGGSPALQAATRGVHRAAASTVLLLVLALLALAARPPRDPTLLAHALALLALALALAALGIVTPRSTSASVLLGNLLGGLTMLALAWRMLCGLGRADSGAAGAPRQGAAARALAALTTLAWLLQAGVGVSSGAALHADAPLVHLALVHLALALLALPLAAATGWAAMRRGRRGEGLALMLAAALQALLGAASAASAAAPASVLLHNMTAAVGIALAAGLTVSLDASRPKPS